MTDLATRQLLDLWRSGTLMVQECLECKAKQHPPGLRCHSCGSCDLAFAPVSRVARLLSWSTLNRAPHSTFAAELPYTVVVAAVDDGVLIEGRWDERSDAALDLRIDMPVTLELRASGDLPVVWVSRHNNKEAESR